MELSERGEGNSNAGTTAIGVPSHTGVSKGLGTNVSENAITGER